MSVTSLLSRLRVRFRKFSRPRFFKVDEDSDVILPTRGTAGSAGYDFFMPHDIIINPKQTVAIQTGVYVHMPEDMTLILALRSSMMTKISFAYNISIIDSDAYINPASMKRGVTLMLTNIGDKKIHIEKGSRVVQGVFVKYYTTVDDKPARKSRTGLFGSTGK